MIVSSDTNAYNRANTESVRKTLKNKRFADL